MLSWCDSMESTTVSSITYSRQCCRDGDFAYTTIKRVPWYIDVTISVDEIPAHTTLFIDLVRIEWLTVVSHCCRSKKNRRIRDDMGI